MKGREEATQVAGKGSSTQREQQEERLDMGSWFPMFKTQQVGQGDWDGDQREKLKRERTDSPRCYGSSLINFSTIRISFSSHASSVILSSRIMVGQFCSSNHSLLIISS